jgi:hypothetical protein
VSVESDSIAALNDVVMELVAGLASGADVSKGWAYTVVETLSKQSHALGVTPMITAGDVSGWQDEQ